jgi:hypothetical protein
MCRCNCLMQLTSKTLRQMLNATPPTYWADVVISKNPKFYFILFLIRVDEHCHISPMGWGWDMCVVCSITQTLIQQYL